MATTRVSQPDPIYARSSRGARIAGWTLTALIALLLVSGGINALRHAPMVVDSLPKTGMPLTMLTPMGVLQIVCVVLFLVPRTAALGAILLTAYFGGAVLAHARVGDPMWIVPVVVALVVWIALLLREPRFHIVRPSRY